MENCKRKDNNNKLITDGNTALAASKLEQNNTKERTKADSLWPSKVQSQMLLTEPDKKVNACIISVTVGLVLTKQLSLIIRLYDLPGSLVISRDLVLYM